MSLSRVLLVFLLGAGVGVGAEYALRHVEKEPPAPAPTPTVARNVPDDPGDPPIVWLEGALEEVSASSVGLREGQGPLIRIGRFHAGATDFLRLRGTTWRELSAAEVEAIRAGEEACVEAFLDGRRFFALRVFLGARCGPA